LAIVNAFNVRSSGTNVNQTDRDTPIRDTISSETNITPVLLIRHYPCKLTVLYFLYYIPCTRARFDKNELGGSGGSNWGGAEESTDENLTRPFFFALTQFLEHPFARDQRFRRPFLLQLSFLEHPFVCDQRFRRPFLLQLSFRSTPLSATGYFDDIFLFQFSVWSTPLSFDQRFRRPFSKLFFSQQALHTARAVAAPEPRSPRSRGGTQTLAGAIFQRTFFRGVFCNGLFQRTLVVQLTGFATGFRRANGFFQQLSVELPGFFNGL